MTTFLCPSRSPQISLTHIHDSGALRLNAATSAEQTHQRLGVAEGVIREIQEQLQRVSAGHQAAHEAHHAIHQEKSPLRSQIDTRSRIRLVELKSLMPDRFGKKSGSSWSTRSHLARNFVAPVHPAPKQAMQSAENRKMPISLWNLQEFGVTKGGPRVANFFFQKSPGLKEKLWK